MNIPGNLLFLVLCLICVSAEQKHIFSQMPESYFLTELPTYLPSPIIYREDLTTCGLVGNASTSPDSYCNSTVLVNIQTIVKGLANNVSQKINSTISTLRDSFVRIGDLLWRRFDTDKTTLEGLKLAFEKVMLEFRKRQIGIGREMVTCLSTMNRVAAGLLCAGCKAAKYPFVIRPSVQPIIHLKSTTVEAIVQNCTRLMELVSGSIDYYHRTKMILVDLLAAQLGGENHLCTCSGQAVNFTDLFNYNVTGVSRILTENDFTIAPGLWDAYMNSTSMIDEEVTKAAALMTPEVDEPYFVTKPPTVTKNPDIDTFAQSILNGSKILGVKGGKLKDYKYKYLSNVTRLAFAVGRIFNHTIQRRSFSSLSQELSQLVDVSGFSFDEIRSMAINLNESYQEVISGANKPKLALIFKLYAKLVIDYLLKPSPSAYYMRLSSPNITAMVVAQYGAALLKFLKASVGSYNFEDQSTNLASCSLPYISLPSGTVLAKSCGLTCNLVNLAAHEKDIIDEDPNNRIIFPLFRIMNRVYGNLTAFQSLTFEFPKEFVDASLYDLDFRNYMMIKFFPPYYYVLNSQERKLSSTSALASDAKKYYDEKFLRYLQEIFGR